MQQNSAIVKNQKSAENMAYYAWDRNNFSYGANCNQCQKI